MAAVGNIFHVEFGINETKLTRAMEEQKWTEAERIINENSHSSFLNEGCYRRIPLFIALSGEQEGWNLRFMSRNLYIARMLIQQGADVNYRIPETCFGSEYMNPGQNALELVVDFYIQVTAPPKNRWNPEQEPVIGLCGQLVKEYEELVDELCDLVFIILGHGGDPNILDEKRMTALHRLLLHSGDLRMIELLCDNGADVNAMDIKGNTPINSLCEGDEDEVIADCQDLDINMEFLEYMVSLKNVQLDHQNRYGCTALFHCMLRGQFSAALRLLQSGCDVTLRGKLYRSTSATPVSPLLAALTTPRCHDMQANMDVINLQMKPVQTCHLAHLVDAGYFTQNQILEEMELYMKNEAEIPNIADMQKRNSNQSQLINLGPKLIHLMFGGTTASLRQLCIREIFKSCFLRDTAKPRGLLGLPMFSIETADDEMLVELICLLNIPKDLLINFQVELFRQQLCSCLQHYAAVLHENAVLGTVNSDSDAESDLDENDSDLEYW